MSGVLKWRRQVSWFQGIYILVRYIKGNKWTRKIHGDGLDAIKLLMCNS